MSFNSPPPEEWIHVATFYNLVTYAMFIQNSNDGDEWYCVRKSWDGGLKCVIDVYQKANTI